MGGFYRKQGAKMENKPMSPVVPILSFIGGVFVGGVAGATAMFLFAPRAGKHTRARLQHQVDELRDQFVEELEDAEEDVLDQAHRVTANVRGQMKEMQHQGKRILSHR